MEGIILFILISVIASIIDSTVKKSREDGKKTRHGEYSEYKKVKPVVNPKPELRDSKPEVVFKERQSFLEGLEYEDRSRAGSLSTTHESEGVEAEQRFLDSNMKYNLNEGISAECENKTKQMEQIETNQYYEEDNLEEFEITAAELRKSVIMSEVLGRPRALKKSIR